DGGVEGTIAYHHFRAGAAHDAVDAVVNGQPLPNPSSAVQASLQRVSGASAIDGHVSDPGLLGAVPVNCMVAAAIVSADFDLQILQEDKKGVVGAAVILVGAGFPVRRVGAYIVTSSGHQEGFVIARVLEIGGIGRQDQRGRVGPFAE